MLTAFFFQFPCSAAARAPLFSSCFPSSSSSSLSLTLMASQHPLGPRLTQAACVCTVHCSSDALTACNSVEDYDDDEGKGCYRIAVGAVRQFIRRSRLNFSRLSSCVPLRPLPSIFSSSLVTPLLLSLFSINLSFPSLALHTQSFSLCLPCR